MSKPRPNYLEMPANEVLNVCQRSFSSPRSNGGERARGAMGQPRVALHRWVSPVRPTNLDSTDRLGSLGASSAAMRRELVSVDANAP